MEDFYFTSWCCNVLESQLITEKKNPPQYYDGATILIFTRMCNPRETVGHCCRSGINFEKTSIHGSESREDRRVIGDL